MVAAPATPATLAVRWDEIPAELVSRPQWVSWAWEYRREQWTKVPIDVSTGQHASTTDPATWAPFEAARAYTEARRLPGAGYVFAPGDPYAGVDLDRCRDAETGALAEWARAIVDDLDSYAEISPRGAGVKLIVRATLPPGRRKDTATGIELYDRGRFFTITGHRLPGVPAEPQSRQAKIDAFHARVFPIADPSANGATEPPPVGHAPADDAALIGRAMRAKNGVKFQELWGGAAHGYPSDSEADAALCALLAFWCGPDRERVDRLFRQSARYRTKWERADYREPTLDVAFRAPRDYCDWAGADDGARFFHVVGGEAATTPEGPSQDPLDYPRTDTGNANLFAARFGDELRYDHRRGAWLRWAGHWWGEDGDGYALRLTERIAQARLVVAERVVDTDERKAGIKWAMHSQSRTRREAMLALAAVTRPLALAGDEWDAEPLLLGVANGVVDLRDGTLHPGEPRDYISRHSPAAYDPRARAPRWERFLREVFRADEELIDWLQRYVGYSLSGDIGDQSFVLGWGAGSNGKSTLLGVLGHIVGSYGAVTPFATLEHARESGPTNDLAALVGRRLVVASETSDGRRFNEARIKALTGGDPITARFLNKEFFTFRPALKLWLGVNHKPVSTDDSRGFWRRVRLVPFLANFEEQPERHLEGRLQGEAAGILAWAVRGAVAWQERGLTPPEQVLAATRAYRRESDPLADFLAECCFETAAITVRANALYHAYLEWAQEQGLRDKELLTSALFGRQMGERFEKRHDRLGWYYTGLGLSAAWQERKATLAM